VATNRGCGIPGKEANYERKRTGMGVGIEWVDVGGDILVGGGVCAAVAEILYV
jgi:hypothetical protein